MKNMKMYRMDGNHIPQNMELGGSKCGMEGMVSVKKKPASWISTPETVYAEIKIPGFPKKN